MIERKITRRINVGKIPVGGGAPVAVQSMTNTDTRDPKATLAQIDRLVRAGCEIVRVAVPDDEAARALGPIREGTDVALVADIHFDHRLALAALERGVDGLRINPGNIGGPDEVRRVAEAAGKAGTPIRIGVNAGSLEKDLRELARRSVPEALVESARREIGLLERFGFDQIKISVKCSDVPETVEACRLLSRETDYPLHLGVTEAGLLIPGVVKSALGIGLLLAEGIGDTIRVSLTRDPVDEVKTAWEILRALGLRSRGVEIISCPTCGRTEIDLTALAEKVDQALAGVVEPLKVAVMGCVVNGPGEARAADIGVAGGRGHGLLFKNGEIIRSKIPEADLADVLTAEVLALIKDRRKD